MNKYLITGGAGFIGSNFLHYMIAKYPNDLFICYDLLTYAGNIANIENLFGSSNFKFIYGNICDKEKLDKLFELYQFDFVINFAAESHVDKSINCDDEFIESNFKGVQVLLNACRKYQVKRFHQVSTDEVYGDLPLDSKKQFNEESNLKPSNPYSATKASADLLILSYFRTYGFPCTISRCSKNFGPYQFIEKLVPLTIKRIMKDEDILIYGNGQNIRDWIYVLDHCSAIDYIVHYGKNGEVYNVSTNNLYNNIEIVNMIMDYYKSSANIKFIKDRPGHDLKYSLNNDKVKKLGWNDTFDFKQSMIETLKWYEKNNKWIKDIENKSYIEKNEQFKKDRI